MKCALAPWVKYGRGGEVLPAVPGDGNSKHRNSEQKVSSPSHCNATLDLGSLKHPSARQRQLAVPQKLESVPCGEKRDEKERRQDTDQQTAPPGELIAKGKRPDIAKERWLQPKPIRSGEQEAYDQEHDQIASPLRRWLNELIGHAYLTAE
jgi:hypothetical protein